MSHLKVLLDNKYIPRYLSSSEHKMELPSTIMSAVLQLKRFPILIKDVLTVLIRKSSQSSSVLHISNIFCMSHTDIDNNNRSSAYMKALNATFLIKQPSDDLRR